MKGLDGYDVLMEEHILRKNKGLPTEHPMEMIHRLKAEERSELMLNAASENLAAEHAEEVADEYSTY